MRLLRIHAHDGSRVSVEGPVTHKRYEYNPVTGNGVLAVEEVDVPGLLSIQRAVTEGCGCSNDGGSMSVIMKPLFEE